MIHELKHIIQKAYKCSSKGEACVLASVVALDGTSYRKPGVRMLLTQSGEMIGAVSGGCVEKEIQQRAQLVFENDKPMVMAYDGRFRLGCEGTLYILIEPFKIDEDIFEAFHKHWESRKPIELISYFKKEDHSVGGFGTITHFGARQVSFNKATEINTALEAFNTILNPCFRLLIIGAEHDAVKLCTIANNMGWEVDVVSTWKDPKTKDDFRGAKEVWSLSPEMLDLSAIDENTAVVLMTHNYALDLKYLLHLQDVKTAYLGVLGSRHRNDQLRMELFERKKSADELEFYGPIGLDIGSETPEEIAIAIIAEILAVTRNRSQKSLSTHFQLSSKK